MKAEIISEGSRHCAGMGKEFQIVSTQETQPPYILGNYPRSEITFMCLSAGDRELQRPKLQKTPVTVIEVAEALSAFSGAKNVQCSRRDDEPAQRGAGRCGPVRAGAAAHAGKLERLRTASRSPRT